MYNSSHPSFPQFDRSDAAFSSESKINSGHPTPKTVVERRGSKIEIESGHCNHEAGYSVPFHSVGKDFII
jgi:hypothetical protein